MKLLLSQHLLNTKHSLCILGLCVCSSLTALAQNSVGIGTANPNSHAVLELKPLGKQGFIMPRLDASDTLTWTLSAKEKGLIFFDTIASRFLVYDGIYWKVVGSGSASVAGSGWDLNSGLLSPSDLTNQVSIGSNITDYDSRLYARNNNGIGTAMYGDSRATLAGTSERIGVRGNAQTNGLAYGSVYGGKFTASSTNTSPTVVGAYMNAKGLNGSTSYGGFSEIEFSGSSYNYGFRTNVQGTNATGFNYGLYANLSGDGTNYGLYTNLSGTGMNYAAALLGGGVGIGTANPRRLLHVAGGVQIDTLAGIGVRMVVADADGSLFTQPIASGGGTAWDLNGNTGTDQDNHFIGTIDKKRLTFKTNNTARMSIDSNDGAIAILQSGMNATDLSTQSASAELRLEGSYWNSDAWAERKEVFRIKNVPDLYNDFSGWLEFRADNNAHLMSLHKNGGMLIGGNYWGEIPPSDGLAVDGNVGIGTTSPDFDLHIVGTYNPTIKLFNTDAGQATSLTAGGYESILEFNNDLVLMSNTDDVNDIGNGNGTSIMRANNNGIIMARGVNSASAWLHVSSDASEMTTTRIENNNDGTGKVLALSVESSAANGGVAADFTGADIGIESYAFNGDGTGGWFEGGATGVRGYANGNLSEGGNTGLLGIAEDNSAGNIGVSGLAYGSSGRTIGLKGNANGAINDSYGVWGETGTDGGIGGYFIANGSNDMIAVYGKAPSDANNWAGKFEGKVHVTNGLNVGTEAGSEAFSVNGKLKIAPSDGDINFNDLSGSIIFPSSIIDTEQPMIYMYNGGTITDNKSRYVLSYSQDDAKTGLYYDASSNRNTFRFTDNSTGTLYNVLSIDLNNQSLGINVNDPSHALHVSGDGKIEGDFYVTGNSEAYNFFTTSDRRYKKNIHTISGALNTIKQLRGVNYLWRKEEFKDKKFNDRLQIGFIAQEVEAIVPELVHTNENGFKAVNYAQFAPILVEALKEQQALIESQAQQIQQLKADLGVLRSLQEDVACLKAEWAGSTAKK